MENNMQNNISILDKIKDYQSRTATFQKLSNQIERELATKTKELQAFNNSIASNQSAIDEQRRALVELESDEYLANLNNSVWSKLLDEKNEILRQEKSAMKMIMENYYSNRAQHCDAINEFLNNEGNLQNQNGSFEQKNTRLLTLNDTFRKVEIELQQKKAIAERENLKRKQKMANQMEIKELLKYQKLLGERETELKKLIYQIKLKNLEKRHELMKKNVNRPAALFQ